VMGGFDGVNRLSSTELLDLDKTEVMQFKVGPELTVPRAGCACVLPGSTVMMVLGGCQNSVENDGGLHNSTEIIEYDDPDEEEDEEEEEEDEATKQANKDLGLEPEVKEKKVKETKPLEFQKGPALAVARAYFAVAPWIMPEPDPEEEGEEEEPKVKDPEVEPNSDEDN